MSELIECIDGLTANQIFRRIAKDGSPSFYLQTKGLGTGFVAEYQAVYDAYVPTIPDEAQADAQNTMVASLVDSGVWAKLDVFWIMANGDTPNALLNWINPALYALVPVNLPTFTPWEGITGIELSVSYVDCVWIPSVNGVNYTQNSASQLMYIRTDLSVNRFHGVRLSADNKDTYIAPRYGDNNAYIAVNSDDFAAAASPSGSGMFVNTRTAANVVKLYRNKVSIVTGNDASIGVPTNRPFIHSVNNDGVVSAIRADQVSMYAFGGGMTQADVDAATDAVNTYMTFLGKNVF